jgi:hypothetical protein
VSCNTGFPSAGHSVSVVVVLNLVNKLFFFSFFNPKILSTKKSALEILGDDSHDVSKFFWRTLRHSILLHSTSLFEDAEGPIYARI